jgi:hypothetical protein
MPPDQGPIRFSDDQIRELIDLAKALPVGRRGDFLEALAERLRGCVVLTAGNLRQAAIAALREVRGG